MHVSSSNENKYSLLLSCGKVIINAKRDISKNSPYILAVNFDGKLNFPSDS